MPSQQALELMKKLEREEEVIALGESGYGREQLVRLALSLACAELRGEGVDASDLVLDYLMMAASLLQGEGPDA